MKDTYTTPKNPLITIGTLQKERTFVGGSVQVSIDAPIGRLDIEEIKFIKKAE